MYCDSDIVYAIETERLNIHFRGCNKNPPKKYILFPYESKHSVLDGRTQEDTSRLIGEKFRVGFNYVTDEYMNDDNIVEALWMHKHLIWSDTLTIK